MREIKYKAVFNNPEESFIGVSVNSFTIKKLASYEEHEWEFKDGSTLPANDVEDDDLEYIQYTGLKDKNGKEIYEGDIIRGNWFDIWESDDITYVYVKKGYIEWIDSDACFAVQTGEHEIFTIARFRCVEIIGNIYENPELLNP